MKNGWEIAGGQVEIFRVRLKEPFITSLGSRSDSVNVSINLKLKSGASGYGEASESLVMAHLKAKDMARVLRRELSRTIGQDARRLKAIVSETRRRISAYPPAAAAFECALTEALVHGFGLRLSDWFGGAKSELDTDITISAGDPKSTSNAARRAAGEGFRVFKIKVGTGADRDFKRTSAVWNAAREILPRPTLLLDGNQGMTAPQALRLVESCLRSKMCVSLFEQPVDRHDLKGMAWLKKRSPVPIAADESASSVAEAYRVLALDAADVLNVKVAKTGLQESLEIVALAKSAGKKLMIGCMRETARGLSASVQLACGTGGFDFVDLDSDHLMIDGLPAEDFTREGRRITLTGR